MSEDTVSEDILNGLLGRTLTEWHVSDEGLCFALDDGRKIYVVALAVKFPDEDTLH